MSRPLRVAMLTHSTLPRGGVVHAMSLSEALEDLGVETVLHAPDSAARGFFRKPRCAAIGFPVEPARRETAEMVEQRVDDYVRWFRRPENRGFDLYHAHDGIGANALATLKEEGSIPAFVRTVHHIDDFADPRLVRRQTRSILAADALMAVSALWRENLIERFGREAELGGNGVDAFRYSPRADGSEAELRHVWVSERAVCSSVWVASRRARTRPAFFRPLSRFIAPGPMRVWSLRGARACSIIIPIRPLSAGN